MFKTINFFQDTVAIAIYTYMSGLFRVTPYIIKIKRDFVTF